VCPTLTSSNHDLERNFDLRLLGTAIFKAVFSMFKKDNPGVLGPKPADLKPLSDYFPISKFMITGGRHVNQYRAEDLAFKRKGHDYV
jgi:hypothetical protein